MRIPNGERAIVDMRKLRDYVLNPSHPLGKHKARVFASALGIDRAKIEDLRNALLAAARTAESALEGEADRFGQRYVLDFSMRGPAGEATVRSCWIILTSETRPRFVSCFVL